MGSEEGGTARALCFEGEMVLTMRKRGRHWFLSNAALAPAVIDGMFPPLVPTALTCRFFPFCFHQTIRLDVF